jgi:dTDP-4-amino-4,6-dideoxygalactose transaminase
MQELAMKWSQFVVPAGGHNNIPVIEHNAHGLFGKYKGKYLGSFAVWQTQSFHMKLKIFLVEKCFY